MLGKKKQLGAITKLILLCHCTCFVLYDSTGVWHIFSLKIVSSSSVFACCSIDRTSGAIQ